MNWNKRRAIKYIDNYSELMNYEITLDEVMENNGKPIIRGEMSSAAPFETQSIVNAEFCLAVKACKELYGFDLSKSLGKPYEEIRKRIGVSVLIGLLIDSNRDDSTWMRKAI